MPPREFQASSEAHEGRGSCLCRRSRTATRISPEWDLGHGIKARVYALSAIFAQSAARGNFSVRLVLQPSLALPPGMVEAAMRTAGVGEHVGEPDEDRRFGFDARGDRAARGRALDHHHAHGIRPEPTPHAQDTIWGGT